MQSGVKAGIHYTTFAQISALTFDVYPRVQMCQKTRVRQCKLSDFANTGCTHTDRDRFQTSITSSWRRSNMFTF